MSELKGASIRVSGIVQGVGFRPFIYSLASDMSLNGWVRNTSAGVEIEVDGLAPNIQAFARALKSDAPPLAIIHTVDVQEHAPNGFQTFEILHSEAIEGAFQPISPDVSICPDCLAELFDPDNRRYRYPFINCTNCGPRFTIIQDIPYDRPKTTMAGFIMCPDCSSEYHDPLDRRFHAQPIACPVCGPQIWLEQKDRGDRQGHDSIPGDEAILAAQRLLTGGSVVAVKGLGGFHLACDASNRNAVLELRQRKLRVDKPFALMLPDLATIEAHCYVNEAEKSLLESRERPIVILRRRPQSTIAPEVTPHQDTLGIMLPYTPLHYLLLSPSPVWTSKYKLASALVMTSGNLREEPIATDNQEALERLNGLADAFLMHNRAIHTRCDDSVIRIFCMPSQATALEQKPPISERRSPKTVDLPLYEQIPLRRSRGYAPFPVRLPWEMPPLLATGAELKNTFCITRDRYAFLSHHIGDMENYETYRSFEDGITHFQRLFRIQPQVIAYDLHPNYLASRYAIERSLRDGLPSIGIQHHHAHIISCLADNGISGDDPVIGVAFDGTGYGLDGHIWGGEFLITDNGGPLSHNQETPGFLRPYHLGYYPLPGGDASTHKPARIALAYLYHAGIGWETGLPPVDVFCAEERSVLRAQLEKQINTPLTSSMGRLFDAVAALAGIRQKINYEAQAAIELEATVDPEETGSYSFSLSTNPEGGVIDPSPLISEIVTDVLAATPRSTIAARFHNTVASMVLTVCLEIRKQSSINTVALSGGVWQNMILLSKTVGLLNRASFQVRIHRLVPANDGGLALGQAVSAYHRYLS